MPALRTKGAGRLPIGSIAADHSGVTFASTLIEPGDSIDILLDGRRIWSTYAPTPRRNGTSYLAWPRPLAERLVGSGELGVRRSDGDDVIASGAVQIGALDEPISLVNDRGEPLMLTKWGRLARSASDSSVHDRLIADGRSIVDVLQAAGWAVVVTSGSLLGAIRSGDLLPHDDDFDLAVHLDADSPADLAVHCYALCRDLEAAGYAPIRHSTAHVQVPFHSDDGTLSHYVDIFTGFHKDGVYNQPFAMRGMLAESDIFPFGEVDIAGTAFPSVANPAAWLALCYGASWREPDPAFHFHVPRATTRRFENWFGVFDQFRTFWDDAVESGEIVAPVTADAEGLAARLPASSVVVDLGCGRGEISRELAARGHHVIAADFSGAALHRARLAGGRVDYRRINFVDRRDVLDLAVDVRSFAAGAPVHLLLSNVLHSIGLDGRANIFLLLRQALRHGGFAWASFPTDEARWLRHEDPSSWHLPLDWVEEEAARFGIVCELIAAAPVRDLHGTRTMATVLLRRSDTATNTDEHEGPNR
ncbi:methyltransferase domain-containing protein [Agromyces atrinae]|uniref:Methyltransferase domain-containing protein n=1 Tax=Agromyces atrinae TaxID=592376 RepID=A0A4V1R2J1_9MICO|nr:methyltransferase domain-containing protein [Agromyces atrinae]NYD66671.1 SAM-dependent methyltransferase [Agromyces atrinae]RXZ87336.1 methyltransferase domain-containing protein [Agromyces atrinae]